MPGMYNDEKLNNVYMRQLYNFTWFFKLVITYTGKMCFKSHLHHI